MADQFMAAADVANAMFNYWSRRRPKAQFTQFGNTARWFRPRTMQMQGDQFHYKMFVQPYSGVRRTKANYESEFPKPRQVDWQDIYASWTDLAEFQATIEYTGLAAAKTKRQAIAQTARTLVEGLDANYGEAMNYSLHQNADCVMALVAAVYAAGGGTYATATSAFLQIDGGSIAQFHKGQILDLREGSDNADVQATVKVNDVYHTSTGPGDVADIGPGIVVTIATENAGDADLDGIADNDEIALSGEIDSNFQSLTTWFSTATVFSVTRTTKGNAHLVPYRFDANPGGSPVTFDWDTHMGEIVQEMAYVIQAGRAGRATQGIQVTGAMLALTTPKINREAISQAGDSARFTTALAMKLDAAKQRELFGEIGFNGVVWHNEVLPPIAFQADPVAVANTVRLIEPSSFFYILAHEGGLRRPERLDKDGRWWRYIQGTNARPINRLIAATLMRVALGNDQPQANVELNNVASSI